MNDLNELKTLREEELVILFFELDTVYGKVYAPVLGHYIVLSGVRRYFTQKQYHDMMESTGLWEKEPVGWLPIPNQGSPTP